jgi:hypothetical protein
MLLQLAYKEENPLLRLAKATTTHLKGVYTEGPIILGIVITLLNRKGLRTGNQIKLFKKKSIKSFKTIKDSWPGSNI